MAGFSGIHMSQEWSQGNYTISTDRSRVDLGFVHEFLTNSSYWAQGRTQEAVKRSIDNSLNFAVFTGDQQVGFARVVTDYATFAWLADVFIIPQHRGAGLGKFLVQTIVNHPELQGFRRWLLATRDAHELYRKFGFNELSEPARWMERTNS